MDQERTLFTGATGFLGGQVYNHLVKDGSKPIRIGRSASNEIVHAIDQEPPELHLNFNYVIHAAGKAHTIPTSKAERQDFFQVNVAGTSNLLISLERTPPLPKAIAFISSIAVYGLTKGENVNEDHMLGAKDPYGQSKLQAEHLLLSWCEKHNVSLTILRLPLVAGPDPPGNLGAMISGISKGYYVSIGGGKARKSMVMANDVAKIIPTALEHPGIYHLTDGYHPSFRELEECIASQLNVAPPKSIPVPVAKMIGALGDSVDLLFPGKSPISSSTVAKITSTLTFDDTKARINLGWNPTRVIDAFRIR